MTSQSAPPEDALLASDGASERETPWQGSRDSHLALGAAIVIVITFVFFLLFFNRFAGIRSANGSGLAGQAVLAGRLPYRDYFLPVPPMHALKNAALARLFGTAIIMPRIVALFERALLALVLYFWLSRLFRLSSAALGAIVAIVVSAGDLTDPISSYNHDTIFWAVLAGFFASICLDWSSDQSGSIFSWLCGISTGICICNKQTIGVGVTLGIFVVVFSLMWRKRGILRALRFAGFFAAGWVVPIAAIAVWLLHNHILVLFLRQILVKGPSAKAAAGSDFVARWFQVTLENPPLLIGYVIAVLLLVPVLKRVATDSQRLGRAKDSLPTLLAISVMSTVAVAAGRIAAFHGFPPFFWLIKSSIGLCVFGCGSLALFFAVVFIFKGLRDQQDQFWLFSTISFICAFMLSLSWPAFEAMVIPGLGFLVAAFLDRSPRKSRLTCYTACAVLLFSLVISKLDNPFAFADWIEPSVQTSTVASSLKELKGFVLPEREEAMLEGVTRIIRDHSSASDTIFTYPSMPIFYALTGRWFPTYGADHNIDACPDDIARQDAATLLRVKPAVIVYYRQDASRLAADEALWRKGRRSGQRDIIAAIETLVKTYSLAGTYDAPPTNLRVQVYVRD